MADVHNPEYKASVIAQLTGSQLKEIAKQNQENAMTKKYCLSILKDGIYQEMTDQEFLDF